MPDNQESVETQSLVLAEGSNKFAQAFYQALKSKPGNFICSPFSAQTVLTMAYIGAGGKTAEEMAKVLHLPSNKDQILDGQKALLSSLEKPELKLATRIFSNKSVPLKPHFKAAASSYFWSDVEGKDFADKAEESRQEINSWVLEKTNNKISDILPAGSITRDTMLILVNAIHFKALWNRGCKFNSTNDDKFYVTPTETVTVPMMYRGGAGVKYKYSEKLQSKICELPYEGNEFSMVLIVPDALDGLADVESKLADLNLTEELSDLWITEADVYLPKFKIESSMELQDQLAAMGMATAFSEDDADFSGITSVPVCISQVIQKAFVEVTPEGTEAAAATAVRVKRAKCLEEVLEREKVICNHPFVFVIRWKNIFLFCGRFSIPEATSS